MNNAEIPCSMYAINNNNNSFKIDWMLQVGAGSDDLVYHNIVVIPPGNYSGVDLAEYITNLKLSYIVYNGAVYVPSIDFHTTYLTCQYNAQNNTFDFTVESNPNYIFVQNIILISLTITPLNNTPNCIFGFSGKTLTATYTAGTLNAAGNQFITISSDSGVDLAGTRSIYIKCLNIHTQAFDSRTKYSGTTLARIPVLQEPFGIVFYNNSTGFKAKCSLKNISAFEIQICDDYGNLVDFNGIDWSVTLQLDIIASSPTEYAPDVPFQ